MRLAEIFERVVGSDAPIRFTAYDGSSSGDPGSDVALHVRTPVAVNYLAQSPNAVGLARAYISMGDKEAARAILDEVLSIGDDSQRSEARSMMDEL